MQDQTASLATPVSRLSKDAWFRRIEEFADEAGYFEPLGPRHSAFFVDESPTLLVTFESVDSIRAGSEGQLPYGHSITRKLGWSHLCIIADGETWYRDPRVYAYFDRLVEDGFFEDFDRVVFYGAGSAGYAAAAFSVTAPGSTVILVQPQATLDPAVTSWDERFPHMRRTSFTDRYGYAPDMIDGAGSVFLIFDPMQPLDAIHAALFTKPFVTKLPCANLGDDIATALIKMDLLGRILVRAGTGSFDAAAFWLLYRTRRQYAPYLRNVMAHLDGKKRPMLNAVLCRSVAERMKSPRFRRRLEQLQVQLAEEGRTMLPPRSR